MSVLIYRLPCPLLLCAALMLPPGVYAKPAKSAAPVASPVADDPQTVLAKAFVTVNGQAQSNARAELLLREQIARGASDTPEMRNAVRQNLVAQAVMAQEASKAGLQKAPLLQAQIELAEQNLLAQAWQQKVLADNPPAETEIKAEFDRQLAELGDTDYRLRHVLVKDEAVAKTLIDKIKAGAKLADLAQETSQDAETRTRGGLSDWINVSRLMPPLAEALKTLTNGQLAPRPIKTDAGWHVLQREESRPFQTMSYEQAKPQMQAIVARRMLDARVKQLIDRAKIKPD
jgi:peptidyl-prolyl cis-trans isomerase C